uniref:WAP domain-containing protein n=1 Tax=Pelusios castaneus TaxID=367368 RepID=A0A8C8RK93_9SAUR
CSLLIKIFLLMKPGTCPPDDIRCIRAEPNECAQDSECRGIQKCCHSRCALRCVNPAKGRGPEKRPVCFIRVVCPMINPPNRCKRDSRCPANMKCCDTGCGKDCVWPVNGTYLL